MKKILYFAFIIVPICSCIGTRKSNAPNYESLSNPPVYLYLKNESTFLDNAIDSLTSIDKTMDVHIWFENNKGLPQIRLFATEHGYLTMEFIDAPELVGYCMYNNHICYIYIDNSKDEHSVPFKSLFVRTESFMPYDSIYKSKIKSDCHAAKKTFYYENVN